MKTEIRKDKTGRNNIASLKYYDGFVRIWLDKYYRNMNIHEKIMARTFYCGNEYPSICIMELIKFDNNNQKSA